MHLCTDTIPAPDSNFPCQDCNQFRWQVSLLCNRGRLWLCSECASEADRNRDSRQRNHQDAYARLIERAFKRNKLPTLYIGGLPVAV